jgi:hypothetical protein
VHIRRVICAALVIGVAGDAQAQAHPGRVDITVSVISPDSVHVEERYDAARSPAAIALRVLTRPCASIENMYIERNGVALTAVESRNGPWMTLRDSTGSGDDSLRLFVRYDVRLAGTGAIPLVHLASALTSDDSTRAGPVRLDVRFADHDARVSFPHMTRQAPGEWSARYVAVPSFVEVAGLRLASCDEGAKQRGDNGGLVWRFFLLVGIMVAWVPLYLAWARRSSEGDAA